MTRWRMLGVSMTVATAMLAGLAHRSVAEPSAPVQSQPAAGPGSENQQKPSLGGPKAKSGERAGMRMRPTRLGRGPLEDLPSLGDDGKHAPGDSFLTDEQIDRLMTFMQHNFPARYDWLARLRQRDPVLFQKRIHQAARMLFPMVRAAAENPELGDKMIAEHKAQLALQDLKEKYSRAKDSSEQTRIREEMRQQMDTAFEARIDRLRLEVRQLQRRLDLATQNLANQEKNKEKFISSRLGDMLSSAAPAQ